MTSHVVMASLSVVCLDYIYNSFGLMVTSDPKGRTEKLPLPKFVVRLSKHTDMTIHWKGLEEHFLMVPLVF
jgi:hypothetical protein